MIIEKDIKRVREVLEGWRLDGFTVCLVPTMGYFHDGHLALMKRGMELADKVIVSLFVNPTQFGSGEDLENYPNDLKGDFEKAAAIGVNCVFCPKSDKVYKDLHKTSVTVSELSEGLCGKDRPNHFKGVTTIVTKLLNIVQPQYVVFGEKDFQQLTIIRQMVQDLNFPVEVIGYPIVREKDGLAMSSRNAYLNKEERKVATSLYNALCQVKEQIDKDKDPPDLTQVLKMAERTITKNNQCEIDYFTIVDAATLQPQNALSANCRVAGAIKINGKVRLIDNMQIS